MVQNRIVKVQKRNRALVKFDADKIRRAIFKAGQSIGGLAQDCLPGINEKLFNTWNTDETLADFLADAVVVGINSGDKLRMMWVSGPSSSGKTTTTVKLTERLQKQGLRFLMLNLDDYFWSLVEHPTDWINDRNYETPEALDIQLLNQHLVALLN